MNLVVFALNLLENHLTKKRCFDLRNLVSKDDIFPLGKLRQRKAKDALKQGRANL